MITQTVRTVLSPCFQEHLMFHFLSVSQKFDLSEVSVVQVKAFFNTVVLLSLIRRISFWIFLSSEISFGHDIFFHLKNLPLNHRSILFVIESAVDHLRVNLRRLLWWRADLKLRLLWLVRTIKCSVTRVLNVHLIVSTRTDLIGYILIGERLRGWSRKFGKSYEFLDRRFEEEKFLNLLLNYLETIILAS